MRTGTIYMHEFPNGQRYIGQTTNPLYRRFKNGKGYENCPEVRDAIAEFGWHSVKTYILYRDIPIDELRRYETLCIDRWQTNIDGLNRDRGKGSLPDEWRAEHSKRMAGDNNPMKRSEVREKNAKSQRGKKRCVKTRTKISENNAMKHPEVVKKSLTNKRQRALEKRGQGTLF